MKSHKNPNALVFFPFSFGVFHLLFVAFFSMFSIENYLLLLFIAFVMIFSSAAPLYACLKSIYFAIFLSIVSFSFVSHFCLFAVAFCPWLEY